MIVASQRGCIRMKFGGGVVSWAVVLMAAFSLLSIICLFQADRIVHGDLYSYGLQFSYNWATPYWTMTKIAFALGWLNLLIAATVQLYLFFRQKEVEQLVLDAEKARSRALEILKTESKGSEETSKHKKQESERPEESEIEQEETRQEPSEKNEELPITPRRASKRTPASD